MIYVYNYRCVWQAEGDPLKEPAAPLSPGPKSLPRIRLPMEIIAKLREMADWQPPQIRPSIKYVQVLLVFQTARLE